MPDTTNVARDDRLAEVLGETAESILMAYPDGVVVVDSAGHVMSSNARGSALARVLDEGDGLSTAQWISSINSSWAASAGVVTGKDGERLDVTAIPLVDGMVALLMGKDQALERNLLSALIDSRQRYRDLVEVSSDFAWEVGADGRFTFVSPRGALDYRAEDLVGRLPDDILIDRSETGTETSASVTEFVSPFATKTRIEQVEVWMRRADGKLACLRTAAIPLTGTNGQWRGARGVCHDITAEKERDAELARARQREKLLNQLISTIRDEIDPQQTLVTAARVTARSLDAKGCAILRYNSTAEGKTRMILSASFGAPGGPGPGQIQKLAESADGAVLHSDNGWQALVAATRYRHGSNGMIGLWKPADEPDWGEDERILVDAVADQLSIAIEQLAHHERIVRLSRTDELTGLLNRRAFFSAELPRRFDRLRVGNSRGALFYVDLDNFKLVNDVHGHQKGDEALSCLTELLRSNSRPGDAIARFGGDEFGLWVDGISAKSAEQRAVSLIKASEILKQFSGDPSRPLGISVGVAIYDPDSGESIDELCARADQAMYEAKREGKGRFSMAPPAVAKN
jgi:diguanylate cyclase (GGDEF)-like protein/PAS domain S-box-containing protein